MRLDDHPSRARGGPPHHQLLGLCYFVHRTRSTADISWVYLGALGAGIVLWLTYGVISRDAALVATNIATSLAIGVLALQAPVRPLVAPAAATSASSCSVTPRRLTRPGPKGPG